MGTKALHYLVKNVQEESPKWMWNRRSGRERTSTGTIQKSRAS